MLKLFLLNPGQTYTLVVKINLKSYEKRKKKKEMLRSRIETQTPYCDSTLRIITEWKDL